MDIEQIRNATIIVTYKEYKILVDPMFARKNTFLSLQTRKLIRGKKTNPMVDLPLDMDKKLNGVTHALLTHNHFDHIDEIAMEYLRENNITVYCNIRDEKKLRKKGLKVIPLKSEEIHEFLGGTIKPIEARHGWGWISKPMGYGVGYIIDMPNEPILYIVGDTVLTDKVRDIIVKVRPEWTVLASGKAKLGVGRPLLMDEDEILEVVELSHGKVILNHLEAMDHCLIDRKKAREIMLKNNLLSKIKIPKDGEVIRCD